MRAFLLVCLSTLLIACASHTRVATPLGYRYQAYVAAVVRCWEAPDAEVDERMFAVVNAGRRINLRDCEIRRDLEANGYCRCQVNAALAKNSSPANLASCEGRFTDMGDPCLVMDAKERARICP